jgi:cytochrome P450
MGWGWSFGMMSYGDQWKKHRKVFHQYFNQNAVEKYHHIQIRESRVLLKHLIENPDDFLHHIRL